MNFIKVAFTIMAVLAYSSCMTTTDDVTTISAITIATTMDDDDSNEATDTDNETITTGGTMDMTNEMTTTAMFVTASSTLRPSISRTRAPIITPTRSTPVPDISTSVETARTHVPTPAQDISTSVESTSIPIATSTPTPDISTSVESTSIPIATSTPAPYISTSVESTSTPAPDVSTSTPGTINSTPLVTSTSTPLVSTRISQTSAPQTGSTIPDVITTDATTTPKPGANTLAIALGVIFGVVAVIAVIIIVFFVIKKKRQPKRKRRGSLEEETPDYSTKVQGKAGGQMPKPSGTNMYFNPEENDSYEVLNPNDIDAKLENGAASQAEYTIPGKPSSENQYAKLNVENNFNKPVDYDKEEPVVKRAQKSSLVWDIENRYSTGLLDMGDQNELSATKAYDNIYSPPSSFKTPDEMPLTTPQNSNAVYIDAKRDNSELPVNRDTGAITQNEASENEGSRANDANVYSNVGNNESDLNTDYNGYIKVVDDEQGVPVAEKTTEL